ncbi:hypothetical protein ASE66_29360 [Bosea sp. Root483D1]|nr:hypothetical protein ASE66_29360 [Bosea sp. Root483D1]
MSSTITGAVSAGLALGAIGQNMAQPPCQCLTCIGLAEELDPRIDASATDDGVVRIAGGGEDGDFGKAFTRLTASSGLRNGLGMTTSVNSTSIGMPLSMMGGPLCVSLALRKVTKHA